MITGFIEHDVPTNGIRLHVIQKGPPSGPLAILLHGFPEFWYGWRHQIDPLVEAGFWVWVPDQRGYNLSDKPRGRSAYTTDILATDVTGLIDAAGREKAWIIGHDWGGAVAWHLALTQPQRIEKLININIPHPSVMRRALPRNGSQLLRSWYIFFFQLPWLPEKLIGMQDWRPGLMSLQRTSRPGTFTAADLERYRAAWSQRGAMTAMINWYRAAPRMLPPLQKRVSVPTLLLWGKKDVALNAELAPASIELCEQGHLVFFDQATHWVQHEEPARVNELILEFFKQSEPQVAHRASGAIP
jgi:pimeloyl-ACP methyl ester carboxylesterase